MRLEGATEVCHQKNSMLAERKIIEAIAERDPKNFVERKNTAVKDKMYWREEINLAKSRYLRPVKSWMNQIMMCSKGGYKFGLP